MIIGHLSEVVDNYQSCLPLQEQDQKMLEKTILDSGRKSSRKSKRSNLQKQRSGGLKKEKRTLNTFFH